MLGLSQVSQGVNHTLWTFTSCPEVVLWDICMGVLQWCLLEELCMDPLVVGHQSFCKCCCCLQSWRNARTWAASFLWCFWSEIVRALHPAPPSHLMATSEESGRRHWTCICHEPQRAREGLVLKYVKALRPGLVYITFHSGGISASLRST